MLANNGHWWLMMINSGNRWWWIKSGQQECFVNDYSLSNDGHQQTNSCPHGNHYGPLRLPLNRVPSRNITNTVAPDENFSSGKRERATERICVDWSHLSRRMLVSPWNQRRFNWPANFGVPTGRSSKKVWTNCFFRYEKPCEKKKIKSSWRYETSYLTFKTAAGWLSVELFAFQISNANPARPSTALLLPLSAKPALTVDQYWPFINHWL